MHVAYEILQKLAEGKFYSGEVLAQACKVSRARIWQAVELLRSYGLNIHAVRGRGYSLLGAIELIDRQKVQDALQGKAQLLINKVEVFNQIDSTNDYILRSLRHIPSGYLCLAEGQAKGRGRGGKSWFSPLTKNITFSYYQILEVPVYQIQALSLIVGLAVVESVEEIIGFTPGLGVKWPNDIWYQGAKLCGILVETHNVSTNHCGVIIGIGLNTHKIDHQLAENAITSLQEISGQLVSRNQLISAIMNRLIEYMVRYQHEGLEGFMTSWLKYDVLLNQKVSLGESLQEQDIGVARGINEQGAILIEQGGESKPYLSADIHVRPYATSS